MDEQIGTELTIHQQETVVLTQNGGLDSIIKPLTKEIHLFDSYVAGVSLLTDKSVLSDVKPGDRLNCAVKTLNLMIMQFSFARMMVKRLGIFRRKTMIFFPG